MRKQFLAILNTLAPQQRQQILDMPVDKRHLMMRRILEARQRMPTPRPQQVQYSLNTLFFKLQQTNLLKF